MVDIQDILLTFSFSAVVQNILLFFLIKVLEYCPNNIQNLLLRLIFNDIALPFILDGEMNFFQLETSSFNSLHPVAKEHFQIPTEYVRYLQQVRE